MKPAQQQFNANTGPNARVTLKWLPGVFLLGVIASISSTQIIPETHTSPSQCTIAYSNTDLISQTPHDILFKIMLNLMIDLLDEIVETQPASHDSLALDALSLGLSQTASHLITDYSTSGLDPNLTSAEISDGLTQCVSAMEMLNDPDNEISLSLSTQNALKTTITSIYGELNNATTN